MKKREIRVVGDLAYVPLTKGYEAVIDAADVLLVEGRNWCAAEIGRTVYAQTTVKRGGRYSPLYLHRCIAGEMDGYEVDHVSGDGLDNRRANLRKATHGQNMMNLKLSIANRSGIKGVCWHKGKGKWRAEIRVNGKKRFLGYHENKEAAGASYAAASRELHREFGRVA